MPCPCAVIALSLNPLVMKTYFSGKEITSLIIIFLFLFLTFYALFFSN